MLTSTKHGLAYERTGLHDVRATVFAPNDGRDNTFQQRGFFL